ncbi:pentatricopeptide repeat-containing protein At5g65560-like isoform X1 [Andrographis paniculata]|uniref:pentatricopeptide repeat-containing protein At5g65560-like isoform X1 n=1 Tax=Andrographis paniculata TaxID=175694 RepID=UPI0021E966E7|nr:pentatricopeptide repeat-containing protein At5g65560-like isoform X1 [Andrographis paniculata]XP_051139344.1 pentatricopeptide repeat-containing protein At5g65560-like isoform X1 [Andrographis paniculata]XP_051139345.1 pentatricopeptide repeat-containing protein At5g65560-like isoform X1 [Andrographis paniculata]
MANHRFPFHPRLSWFRIFLLHTTHSSFPIPIPLRGRFCGCPNSSHHSGNALGSFTTSLSSSSIHTFIPKLCSHQRGLEQQPPSLRNFVFEIVDIVTKDGDDMESRLSLLASNFSVCSITHVFKALNSLTLSGSRLFEWIWNTDRQLRRNPLLCSLLIDNVGRLHDYETMHLWLRKFTSENIYLTFEAFTFLASTNSSSRESSTARVVNLLNQVGGSSQNSGVPAMLEMFSKANLFEMARYVIKITKSKGSYYCLLIRDRCRRGLIQDAYDLIREMRNDNCLDNQRAYNYLLGSLWKTGGGMGEPSALLKEMEEDGILPDAITYEILINHGCKSGKMDFVLQLLDRMKSQGIEPRLETLALIVKAYFAAEKYEAAHKYAVDLCTESKNTSRNFMYSLMAKLYWKKGDIMSARNTLIEMMEKGLKPDFKIYMKIARQVRGIGMEDLAGELESMYSKL